MKGLGMIRSFFSGEHIGRLLRSCQSLCTLLLQDSLAIIKEFFMLNICHNKADVQILLH